MIGEDIFSTLGKYSSAKDENYLTESFVFLINELLRREPSLRGEDGVVPAKQAVKVLSRLLRPLLAAEGLDLFAPESPELGVDLFAATVDHH